ncbi:highly divergent homeobox isoform X3 [Lampetra planeri]
MNSKWMMYRRSVISPEQHQILQHFYDVGMTNQSVQCFGLIMDCSQQTGLDYNVVRAWIGNKRRKLMQEAVKGMKAEEQLHSEHHQHQTLHYQHQPAHHPPPLGRAIVKTEPSLSPVPASLALASSPMQLPQSRQQHFPQGSPLVRILPKTPMSQLSQSCQSKLLSVATPRMGGTSPGMAMPGGVADRGSFHVGHMQRMVSHGQGSGIGQICRSVKVEVPLQSRPSKVYPIGFLDHNNSQRVKFPGVQPKVEQLAESVSSPRQWGAELLGGRNSGPREPGQPKLPGASSYGPYDLEIQNVVSLGAGPSTSKAASSYYKQVAQTKPSANSTSGNGNSFSIAMETGDLDEYSREEEMAQSGCQLQESFMEYIDLEEDEEEDEEGDAGAQEDAADKRNGNDAGDDAKMEPGDGGAGGGGGAVGGGGGGGGTAETGEAGPRVQPFSPAQDRVVRAAKSLVCLSESVSRIGSPSVHAAKSDGVAVSGSTPHQSVSPITSFTQGFLPIGTQSPGQHQFDVFQQPYLLNVGLGGMPYLSPGRKRVMQDRTQFSPRDLVLLKRYWDSGMTSLGTVCREKIESVANELNIDFEIVKNWIGNQRRRCRQQGMEPPQPHGGPPDFPRYPKENQGSHHHLTEITSQYLGRGMQDISLDGHGQQDCDIAQSPGSREGSCYDIDSNGIASGLRGHDDGENDEDGCLMGELEDADSTDSMDAQHLEHTQGEMMYDAGPKDGSRRRRGRHLDNESCGSSEDKASSPGGRASADRNHLPGDAYEIPGEEQNSDGYQDREGAVSPEQAGDSDDARSRCQEEDDYSSQKTSMIEELQGEVQRQREENLFLRRLLADVESHVQDEDWQGLQNLVASLPEHATFTEGEENSGSEHPPTGKAACENLVASLSEELCFDQGDAPEQSPPPSEEAHEHLDASLSEKEDASLSEQPLPDDAAEKNLVASLSEELCFDQGDAPEQSPPPSEEAHEHLDASLSEKEDVSLVSEQPLPDDAAEKESQDLCLNTRSSGAAAAMSVAEPELGT